jgi:Ni,Fe-hydrogenase III large subunit
MREGQSSYSAPLITGNRFVLYIDAIGGIRRDHAGQQLH